MFSAVKFVVASVIVALFGGFLLADVLTTPQGDEVAPAAVTASPATEATSEPTETSDPSARTDIVPGVALTVEEAEPGVFRVIDDGAHDTMSENTVGIEAGRDGGVWLLQEDDYLRLGAESVTAWPADVSRDFQIPPAFDVAADGTVWTVLRAGGGPPKRDFALRSYDGSGWRTHKWLPRGLGGPEVEVAADDTVWIDNGFGGVPFPDGYIGRLDPEGWLAFKDEKGHLAVLEDGTAVHVTVVEGVEARHVRVVVRRFDGNAWYDWRTAIVDEDPWSDIGTFAGHGATIGPDGTVWAVAYPLIRSDSQWPAYSTHVMRLDAGGEREWHPDDGVPGIHLGSPYVGPDGSLWGTWSDLENSAESAPTAHDNGVARFDGQTWGHFLLGHSVLDMDIGLDGSVWVVAHEEAGPHHLYVITPEAVAATK